MPRAIIAVLGAVASLFDSSIASASAIADTATATPRSSLLHLLQNSKQLDAHGLGDEQQTFSYVSDHNLNVFAREKEAWTTIKSSTGSMGSLLHTSVAHPYVTCSSGVGASDARLAELEAVFGSSNPRIAAIDHDADVACFVMHGTAQQANRVTKR